MLRKIRRFFAALFFVGITLLFLDFTGTLHAWLGWMAKIQFLPAVLALNFGVVAALLVLTLLFGRVYCSVICPLGVFQDVVSHIAGKIRKNRFSYSPALRWMRYAVLVLFIVAMVAGVGSFVALLAPYSSYGRMVSNLLAPIYQWGNNIVAGFAERAGSYAAYETDVWVKSIPTFIIAALTFVVMSWLAWRGGRTYCNTICPVGTVLGVVSRFSLDSLTENGLFPMEIALDHLWFKHLDEALRHLKGDDRKLAEKIYSVDVDLKNILMLTRYSYYFHLPPEKLKSVLIPMGYIATEADKRKAAESDDPMGTIREIVERHYPQISEEIAGIRRTTDDLTAAAENADQILRIEAYLGERRKKEYMKLLGGSPFSIGVVLAYFFLYKHEDSLVSAVLSAKNYKWTEDRLREALS